MKEIFAMSAQLTSMVSPNTTFLQALEAGRMLSALPVGPMTDPFGLRAALVGLSASQAEQLGFLTSGTCGHTSSISPMSTALATSLASRLQARTDSLGSTLFLRTWKARATPSGRSICALRASVRRTSDRDSTGALRGWASPQGRDGKGSRTGEAMYTDRAGRPLNEQTANLLDQWATDQQPVRLPASGGALTGSSAAMARGGQLNPAHSRWLMGFPAAWDACGVTAMPLSRRSQRRS
jgi:hypothetical protein